MVTLKDILSLQILSLMIISLLFHQTNSMSFNLLQKDPAIEFIVLHNNDMHARFEQTSQHSTACHPDDAINNRCYGGFARTSSLIKKYRHAADNGGPKTLYLNAGDTYTGTPWFTIYKDKIVSAFLNMLKPDAMSLGNHELDLGVPGLLPMLNNVTFPVLIANLNNSANHPLYQTRSIKKSAVFDVNGHKVGVIGYLTPETKEVAQPNDLDFIDEVIGINEEAEALNKKDVKIIIALGHSGYEVDQRIARDCPLVDVVVGGHSNTFLWNGGQPDVEEIDGPYPTVITQESGKQVPVVQAYAYTKYMGELKLSFDDEGNLLSFEGQPILLNSSYEQDPEVLKLLESYRGGIDSLENDHVGVSRVFLDGKNCRIHECNLGNMITDAMVYINLQRYTGTTGWTDVGVGFMQGGGIRASIPSGNITEFDITTVSPFNNTLYVVNVTGKSIYEALIRSVERYNGDHGEFLQVSGMQIVYNLSLPPNQRVISAKIICTDCVVPKFEPLKLDKFYKVIMSSFMHEGGDGFHMFTQFETKSLDISDSGVFHKYLSDFRIIYPAVEGRTILLGSVQKSSSTIVQYSLSLITFAFLIVNLFK